MAHTLTSLTSPHWADFENTMIDCVITTTQFGDTLLPFTASANDPEEHGRKIYSDLIAGVYGDIGEYTPSNSINQEIDIPI